MVPLTGEGGDRWRGVKAFGRGRLMETDAHYSRKLCTEQALQSSGPLLVPVLGSRCSEPNNTI